MAGNFTQDLLTLTAGNGLAVECDSAVPLSVGYDVEQYRDRRPPWRGQRPS